MGCGIADPVTGVAEFAQIGTTVAEVPPAAEGRYVAVACQT